MKRTILSAALGATLLGVGFGAQAAITNFEADVNAAIDAGLAYSRATNQFSTYTAANGLTLLTLLEKEHVAPTPPGYAGLPAGDQTLARQSACLLMTDGNFGGRGGFYAYTDGQVLMALSTYALTGGPDKPAECAAASVRATMDKVVDRTLATQSNATGSNGGCPGMWVYTGPGCDSSTTQFAGSGLASAKGYYISLGDPGGRAAKIQTALNLTANAYATHGHPVAGGLFTNCSATNGCRSHGYQQGSGAPSSSQQTASGTWLQMLGTGKNIDTPSVQGYLNYLQNAYSPLTNNYWESWPPAYFYFLWSSSKAYNLMEDAGSPSAGNIGPADIGTLPALTVGGWTRQANRNPLTDPRVPQRGGGGSGYYAGYPAGWYYDYAYRLMGLQQANGRFDNPNGTWSAAVDHAYALLVLQRAVGFQPTPKCDANGDSVITKADLAIISAARGQRASGPNDPRDSDNDGQITILDVKKCIPLVQ